MVRICSRWAGAALLILAHGACSPPTKQPQQANPVVVVGIDGGSWFAIEELWSRGRLPHFRALAERGTRAYLKPISSASPVIWTSMATGVRPERHGITGFVATTPNGDAPVSSTLRRVPAIWNMASTVERKVAVLGWWVTWPAEKVNGIMASDRATRGVERAFFPPEFEPRFQQLAEADRQSANQPPVGGIALQDQAIAAVSRQLVTESFDLLMVYFRNVDAESHRYWAYFLPRGRAQPDAADVERYGELVPAAYETIDRVLGELVASADPNTDFFVLSDHGFRAMKNKHYRVTLDLDRVLEHLGYLDKQDGVVDWSTTRAIAWKSNWSPVKFVRFALRDREPSGPVEPEDLDRVKGELAQDLAEVTYENGEPAFRIREPKPTERYRGGDLAVVVSSQEITSSLLVKGEALPGAISFVQEITGTHDAHSRGVFLAAGPDIVSAAEIDMVHTLDIAPTLLYAMSLPIGQDFDGKPQLDVFRSEFRRQHPVQTIPTWGTLEPGATTTSSVDEELLDELRALGYLE